MQRILSSMVLFTLLMLVLPALAQKESALKAAPEKVDRQLQTQVRDAVRGLIADTQAEREAASELLLKVAGPLPADADRVLDLLPEPSDQMLPAMKTRLAAIRRAIEDRAAKFALAAAPVTLDVLHQPLEQVLAALEEQTGNKVIDNREQFGQEKDARRITVKIDAKPFWQAMDEVLDQGELGLYPFAGDDELAVIEREEGSAPRRGRAAYAGPFRFEATDVTASRSLRKPSDKSLTVELEVAWEPRLRPIAISQQLADVVAESEDGTRLSLARPEQSLDQEIQPGVQATTLSLPFVLPTRETETIASLKGKLTVLVPGREVTFRFNKLKQPTEPSVKRQGGVVVSLNDFRKNGEIWELHMRLKLEEAGDALASHRGWVFQNRTFLTKEAGQPIDHAGFETTMQSPNELGIAYFFELPDGPEGLTWVYETPAAIVTLPIEYELAEIELP